MRLAISFDEGALVVLLQYRIVLRCELSVIRQIDIITWVIVKRYLVAMVIYVLLHKRKLKSAV